MSGPGSHSMTLESQDKGSGRVQSCRPGFESCSAPSHQATLGKFLNISEAHLSPPTKGVIIVPNQWGL